MALTVKQQTDLSADFVRQFRNGPGQFGRNDLGWKRLATIKLIEFPYLIRL